MRAKYNDSYEVTTYRKVFKVRINKINMEIREYDDLKHLAQGVKRLAESSCSEYEEVFIETSVVLSPGRTETYVTENANVGFYGKDTRSKPTGKYSKSYNSSHDDGRLYQREMDDEFLGEVTSELSGEGLRLEKVKGKLELRLKFK